MQANNKRIAKNTILLYIRSFITMIIGLYTSRIVLEALGVDNYGIQNVVGGIVSFSSLITSTMAGACSRYITFALGKGDMARMKTVFTTSANVQVVMGIIAVIVLEIVGVWFLNSAANIPEGRMTAANWVLQFSIISVFISLVAVPYRSVVIAHEHMSMYAWMSILDSVLRLGIAFLIMLFGFDRLIFYSALLVVVGLINVIIYAIYSLRIFEEVSLSRRIDKGLLKEMTQYSGWNLLNNSTWLLCTQGVNMLVNVYYGVAYNAARGIAGTVSGCAQGFVDNFGLAFRPQITKTYAAGELQECFTLANRGMKFLWLMFLFFIVPICIEAHTILNLWLTEVPPMCTLFVQLSLFECLAVQSGQTMLVMIQASGNVKRYSIEAALYSGLVFPLVWISFHLGMPVWSTYPVMIFIFLTLNIVRVVRLKHLMGYRWESYLRQVVYPCLTVTLLAFIPPMAVAYVLTPGFVRLIVVCIVGVISTGISSYAVGLTRSERQTVKSKVLSYIHRR